MTSASRVLFALTLAASAAAHAAPSLDEMWQIIQRQQTEIADLRTRLAAAETKAEETRTAAQVTEQRLDATSDFVEARLAERGGESSTHLGGYGEVHYTDVDQETGSDDKTLDTHRFVAFISHEFDARTRFFSEVEIEHAVAEDTADGSGEGEVELEQAYVEMDLNDRHYLRAGQFLVPVGILNETHEPPTFYGVERNEVESVIIPSTWWEGGVDLGGHYASGFSWDAAVHSGLETPVAGDDAFRIREGRQEMAEARANDLAYTLRLSYTGVPGLTLAGSVQYQSDMSQRSGDGLEDGLLTSLHGVWTVGGMTLKALWARWQLDGALVEAARVDEQTGWYVEPSYRFDLAGHGLGLYGRWQDIDAARTVDRFDQWELGFNYWPLDRVVFKFDYRDRSHDLTSERGRDFQGVDLGVGWQF